MTNITIRNIPEKVYEKIKASAIANKRSINSEILYGLEQNYYQASQDKAATLENIRRLRAKTTKRIYLTEAEIAQAKGKERF